MVDVYKFLKRNTNVELVWNNKGAQVTFKSNILYVFDDRLFLAKPKSEQDDVDNIDIYEKMQLVVCTEEGVLSGNVNLLEKMANEKGDVFISFPYNTQFCQRRENTRIPMHVDFELILDNTLNLKSKNISGRGLACITDEPLPEFTDKQLVLHMPNADINIRARKVYSKEIFEKDNAMFLNGIEFVEIDENDVGIIVKNCLKFQMDAKHNERLFETL